MVQRAARLRQYCCPSSRRTRRWRGTVLRAAAHGVLCRRRRAGAVELGAARGGGAQRCARGAVWFTTSWGSTETSQPSPAAHWKLERAAHRPAAAGAWNRSSSPTAKLGCARGVTLPPATATRQRTTRRRPSTKEGLLPHRRRRPAGRRPRPERGVAFHGRVARMTSNSPSGTWVSVGALRLKVVSALAPLAGRGDHRHDRGDVGVLLFPQPPQARGRRRRTAAPHRAPPWSALRAEGGGSSMTPVRARLTEPPSADAGEITDKGYINQGAVLRRRRRWTRCLRRRARRAGHPHLNSEDFPMARGLQSFSPTPGSSTACARRWS